MRYYVYCNAHQVCYDMMYMIPHIISAYYNSYNTFTYYTYHLSPGLNSVTALPPSLQPSSKSTTDLGNDGMVCDTGRNNYIAPSRQAPQKNEQNVFIWPIIRAMAVTGVSSRTLSGKRVSYRFW